MCEMQCQKVMADKVSEYKSLSRESSVEDIFLCMLFVCPSNMILICFSSLKDGIFDDVAGIPGNSIITIARHPGVFGLTPGVLPGHQCQNGCIFSADCWSYFASSWIYFRFNMHSIQIQKTISNQPPKIVSHIVIPQ